CVFPPADAPGSRLLIIVFDNCCGIACDDRVVWDISHHNRMSRNYAIAPDLQFSSRANNCCGMANPGSLSDANRSASIDTLVNYCGSNIFVFMIVVEHQHHLTNEDIAL